MGVPLISVTIDDVSVVKLAPEEKLDESVVRILDVPADIMHANVYFQSCCLGRPYETWGLILPRVQADLNICVHNFHPLLRADPAPFLHTLRRKL